MEWVRGDHGSDALAISLNAVLIILFLFVTLAWRSVLRREISTHRRWALRT